MKNDDELKKRISEEVKGLQIESMEWEAEGEYWVITFTNGFEMCVQLMAEKS